MQLSSIVSIFEPIQRIFLCVLFSILVNRLHLTIYPGLCSQMLSPLPLSTANENEQIKMQWTDQKCSCVITWNHTWRMHISTSDCLWFHRVRPASTVVLSLKTFVVSYYWFSTDMRWTGAGRTELSRQEAQNNNTLVWADSRESFF